MPSQSLPMSTHQIIDGLKHSLLCTTLELESTRMNAQEAIRKNEEYMKQLLHILKVTCQERDEARDQLQRLLNQYVQSTPTELCPVVLSNLHVEDPQNFPIKGGNSSLTESDSLSETYNHQSYVSSSPVESFFDAVSSPDIFNINMADSSNTGVAHQPYLPEYNGSSSMAMLPPLGTNKIDRASAIIESLAREKPLPVKGKLLQTVMEAGPLLKQLFIAGPLPQWRNPPPLQPLQVAPISMKGSELETVQKPIMNPNYTVHSPLGGGGSQICATSVLNFPSGVSSGLKKRPGLSSISVGRNILLNQSLIGKRQKF